jgi:hypothetical protein
VLHDTSMITIFSNLCISFFLLFHSSLQQVELLIFLVMLKNTMEMNNLMTIRMEGMIVLMMIKAAIIMQMTIRTANKVTMDI